MWICWAWSWEVTEEISHLLLLCHRAGSTDVPSSMMPLRFPVSTCQTMGARQSAMLHWGWSQVRSKRREQNSSLGWSCALRVLGYWLGMTDPSLSSNLKVGLVTGSPLFYTVVFQQWCHLSSVQILWSLQCCEENPGTLVLLSQGSTVHSDFPFCLPAHSETKTNEKTQHVPREHSDPAGKGSAKLSEW